MILRLAVATAFAFAVVTAPALAQTANGLPPSQAQKLRQGNLYVSTDYGAVDPQPKKPVRKRAKPNTASLRNPPLPDRNPARTGEVDPLAQSETLSGARALALDLLSMEALDALSVETGTVPTAQSAAAPSAPEAILPCRKFEPTIGRTIEVACE
jgi:hypothetical protein